MKLGVAMVIALGVAACGKDGGRARPADPIGLVSITNKSARRPPWNTMVFLGGKLVEVDPADVYGNPDKPFRGLDPQGRLTPASGAWRPAQHERPSAAGGPPPMESDADTIVIVDRDVPAATVRAALAPLGERCVGFLGTKDGALAALIPDPCPPREDKDTEMVELTVLVDKDKSIVSLTRVNEVMEIEDRAKLLAELRTHKQGAFFAERKDLVIALHHAATIGEVIEMRGAVHGVGFTSPRWVEPAQLPEVSTGPAAAPKVAPTVSLGQPVITGDLDRAILRRYLKHHIAKLQRCYDQRRAAKPGLAGTVTASFRIERSGKVATSSATGVDPELASCIAAAIKDIEFPEPK